MTPWTQRQYGQCAYLLTRMDACCAPVARGSAMADRYCLEHYNLMIDRDGMRRAQAKRGGYNKGVPARLATGWDYGREGGK